MKSTKFISIVLSVLSGFFSTVKNRKTSTVLLFLVATFCFWAMVAFRTGAWVSDQVEQKSFDSSSTPGSFRDEIKRLKGKENNEEVQQFTPGTCDTAGPIEVESTGGITLASYPTLRAAFNAINSGTHTGTITIDVCGDTTETATASLNASGSGSANYTSVTISPAGGAARTISGSISGAALVQLNGADNVTINGLNSGGNSLTISNTSTAGTSGTSTIRLVADATGNTITNCSILGSSTTGLTTNGGTIFISTAGSGGNGNDNNTFSNNKIGPAGTNLPTKAVYANGSTSTTASYNNNITFSNNEIFDYFSATAASIGIYLAGGNDNWTISNNKFYQTAPRTQTSGVTHAAINVANSTGNTSHTFSGNTIGFANATGTGNYQITLGNNGRFAGIWVSAAGKGGNYNIQNNTITNIDITGSGNGSGTSAGFAAIFMGSGSTATISGNTIGSTTTGGAISYSSSSSFPSNVYGIYFFSSENVTISNNIVAGITATNSSTAAVVIYGIRASTNPSATNTIQNNTIGSSSAPIQNTASSTSSRVIGILSESGASVVIGNTVRNLTMSAGNTGTGTSASVIGVFSSNISATNNNISQNTIHSLSNTNTTAAVAVTGLVYNGNTSAGTYLVARNFIHSLSVSSLASAVLRGILHVTGNATYQNNMIRLGIDAAGNSVTGPYDIAGYAETVGSNNFYHNTIYIGGSSGISNAFTNALSSAVTVNTRKFINNVLINDRSISGGSGANLAATFTGSLPNPSGLTSNYNFYYSQNAITLIRNGSTNYSLSGWRTASGNQDGNSFQALSVAQFNLVNPTGDASNVDLHIANTGSTILERTGTPISSVTDDFDGQLRASFTPVDIGADAGNFTQPDAFPPVITYTPLNNTASTSNRNLSVTITDFTGVASGTLAPRIYYRKGTSGPYVSTQCTGTQPNYTCTIDYSLVGGVVTNDTIQYFVVAQDTLGNLAANPNAGFAGTDVNNITTPPTNPNQYRIAIPYSGTLYVGSSELITSLTNAGGLFELLNNNVLVGNLTVIITSDLTNETGANPLNQLTEEGSGAGTYTITIQPSGARTIEFTATGTGIRLTGADRVTIDGLNTGGNSLIIRNPNTSATATISFSNDSLNNTVRNATIEGAATSTSGGVIFFGSGTTTGNDNNTITQNVIRNLSVGTGTPAYLINSSGSSATVTNTNNSITNNILKNFTNTAISISSTGNESWTITGNEIFEEAAQTSPLTGISFSSLGTNVISQNSIHDLNTSNSVTGIILGDARNTTVSRNRIFSIPSTSGSNGTLTGIQFSGSLGNPAAVTIVNNMISIIPAFNNNQTIYGIRDFAYSGNTVTIDHNTVLIGGTATGTNSTWALVRGTNTYTTFTARNNILFNNRTGGSGNHFAIGDQSASAGSWTSNYNIFVGTGTTPANFFNYGTGIPGPAVSFAAWQAGPPSRDANSQASNPTGNYTVTNMFWSPTDLHLNVIGTNPAVSSCLPLTAVTADFDNDPRPTGTNLADIGADEVVQSISGVLAGGTYYNAAITTGDSLGGNVTITFNLTLSGVLNNGSNTLTFGCNATVSNVNPSRYVVGSVAKQFCATGSFTYPIGSSDPNEYTPVTVNVTALGQNPSTLTASVTDAALPGLVPSRSVSRYWTLTEAGDITADLTFQYLDSGGEDVPPTANESDFRVFRKSGSLITNLCPSSPCVNTTANTASVSGVTDFSDWGIGEQVATPGPADVSGRVMTNSGRGIARARVVVTDENGETRVTQTNPFGYYKFRGLTSGQNYIFTVSHKLYRFSQPSIVRFIAQDETDINFIADGFNEGVNPQETYFDRAPFDFDGDGRTDISVWRGSEGQWYIRRSSDGRWESQRFGISDDLIAPADYDGDGRTDIAIFRPSESKWYIILSASSELLIEQFGKNGDRVVPNDYDGDGKADIAVFRPDERRFYILRSSDGQVYSEAFDTKGSLIPMSGDMDGDGKADCGVYNPKTGAWQVIVSNGMEQRAARIEPGGVPVLVDIDGDGRAEIGVYLSKSKLWRFRTSNGIKETQSGSGNIPILGDYDGDGKVDVGTYGAGEWQIKQSASAIWRSLRFGLDSDLPVPSANSR